MSAKNKGFTLLEVLVALAIVAITLTGALRALGNTAQATTGLRERSLGDWVAQNRLTELRVTGAFPDVGTTEGEVVQAGERFIWRMEVERSPNPLFRKVNIIVLLVKDGLTPVSRMNGFVVRPLT